MQYISCSVDFGNRNKPKLLYTKKSTKTLINAKECHVLEYIVELITRDSNCNYFMAV